MVNADHAFAYECGDRNHRDEGLHDEVGEEGTQRAEAEDHEELKKSHRNRPDREMGCGEGNDGETDNGEVGDEEVGDEVDDEEVDEEEAHQRAHAHRDG